MVAENRFNLPLALSLQRLNIGLYDDIDEIAGKIFGPEDSGKLKDICFCPVVRGYEGFHDEMTEHVRQMKLDVNRFKRKSYYFKTAVE